MILFILIWLISFNINLTQLHCSRSCESNEPSPTSNSNAPTKNPTALPTALRIALPTSSPTASSTLVKSSSPSDLPSQMPVETQSSCDAEVYYRDNKGRNRLCSVLTTNWSSDSALEQRCRRTSASVDCKVRKESSHSNMLPYSFNPIFEILAHNFCCLFWYTFHFFL